MRLFSIILLVLFFSISSAMAQSPASTPYAKIDALRMHWSSHLVVVELENINPGNYNPDNCSKTEYFTQGVAPDKAHEAQLAILLSAYMAGEPVRLVIDGCGLVNAPGIISVQLAK
ncbi:MAG: hypothetical protein AAF642_01420 [Pseudomonadota bacterium]